MNRKKWSRGSKGKAVGFVWNDALAKKRWPWKARIEEVIAILEGIGEPFVKVIQTGKQSWSTLVAWRRADLSRYTELSPVQTGLELFNRHCRLLSSATMRKLSNETKDWIHDVREQSQVVAKLAADVDGCIQYLEQQIRARQALLDNLGKVKVPVLPSDLQLAVKEDCEKALVLLNGALRRAKKAEAHLAPCRERFLNKRSRLRRKEELKLVNLLIQHGNVRRRRAAELAAELLATLDTHFITRASSLRVESYDHKQSSI